MKISRGVSYHRVGDKIIIYNVSTLKKYQFDGSIEKVLNYVAANPTHSVPKLLKSFAAQYTGYNSCAAYDKVQRDIGELVDELLGEEIFTEI